MGVIRTTTLALGAALIGSAPGLFLAKPEIWRWALALGLVGLVFVLHGTGFLQKYTIRPILRCLRKKRPLVAIISDLPWKDMTHPWAWDKMDPNQWSSRITYEAKQKKTKVAVKRIEIKRPWVRFSLDRYNVILNPYGSAYPEINIKGIPALNTILDYVLNGGLFVNVADIPFYWAYDPQREILYDLMKHTYQYIPSEYESDGQLLRLKSLQMQSFGPFTETPFLNEVKVYVINTETVQNGEIKPSYHCLKLKDESLSIKEIRSVAINRVALVERRTEYKDTKRLEAGRVQSVVEEIEINEQLRTPICYINFGKGRFLVSLFFLGYDKQLEQAKEQVISLLCELVIKDI